MTELIKSANSLFDVLADSPKSIVAKLLFQQLKEDEVETINDLSEVMGVDLIEVIIISRYPMSLAIIKDVLLQARPFLAIDPANYLLAAITCIEKQATSASFSAFADFSYKMAQAFPSF